MSGRTVARHMLGSLAGGVGAGLLVALVTLLTNLMDTGASPIGGLGDLLTGFGVLWLICAIVYGVWIFVAAGPAAWLLRRVGWTGAPAAALTGAVLALAFSEAAYAVLQFVPAEAPSQRLLFVAAVMAGGAVAALIYRRIVRDPA